MFVRNVFYFLKKVRLFSQNDVLFLFYFLINPAGTTVEKWEGIFQSGKSQGILFEKTGKVREFETNVIYYF